MKVNRQAGRILVKTSVHESFMGAVGGKRVVERWQMADVTAIYKKGSKSHRGNYRPVSLTSVCCKILEQLIREERESNSSRIAVESYLLPTP